ncbi:MAG: hypothetical protein KF833_05945 [Verrucomicrobiae bacterium]|nr:hypothetical protein [Verrucomicrobiae bacterium]
MHSPFTTEHPSPIGSRLARPVPLAALVLVAFASVALACRYSVRDTGFVELGEAPWRLVLSAPATGPWHDLYRPAAAAALLDANIEFAFEPSPDAGEPVLALVASDGRRLELARAGTLPADRPGAIDLLERIALSPVRSEIHQATLDAFAVVLLIEGTDTAANARARNAIDAAILGIARLMPSMPKPVDHPPRLLILHPGDLAREAITVWGLGLEPRVVQDPRVVLLYGRGRRLGAPIDGPLITQTLLQERLAIIGQDCECELDRSWMQGPLVPARWDAQRQAHAARVLGFDPENPLVRTEISRIVLRGPTDPQRRRLPGTALNLGYSEDLLEPEPWDDDPGDDAPIELALTPPPQSPDDPGSQPPVPSPAATATTPVPTTAATTHPAPNSAPNSAPKPAPRSDTDPLDTLRRLAWVLLAVGSVAVLEFGRRRWLRARKEHG